MAKNVKNHANYSTTLMCKALNSNPFDLSKSHNSKDNALFILNIAILASLEPYITLEI